MYHIYMRLPQVYRNAIGFFYINLIPSIFAELPNCSFFWIFYGCNLRDRSSLYSDHLCLLVQQIKEPKMARGILKFKCNRTVSAFPGRSIPPLGTRTSKHFQGKIVGKGSKNSFSILSLPILYGGKQNHIWATDLRHALF